jgi:hypothetical protein
MFLYFLYQNKKDLFLQRKYNRFLEILTSYYDTTSKINHKTIQIFKDHDFFGLFLNKKINYDTHWVVDERNY